MIKLVKVAHSGGPAIRKRSNLGAGLMELLIATALFTIILTFLVSYFRQETYMSQRLQARNDLETSVRLGAELMLQDLQMAGSRAVVSNLLTATRVTLPCFKDLTPHCLEIIDGGSASDSFVVFYATSLRAAEPCRRVDYALDATSNTLQRSSLAASGAGCAGLSTANLPSSGGHILPNPGPLADNITEILLTFTCSSGTVEVTPSACYAAGGFPRQATVTVSGQSPHYADMSVTVTLSTALPNLKDG